MARRGQGSPGDPLVSGMWGALGGPRQVRVAGWLGGTWGLRAVLVRNCQRTHTQMATF